MLDTLERVDVTVELIVNWDEEIGCESQHVFSKGFCTVKAEYVAVGSCDHVSTLWCAARYREFMKTVETRNCVRCHRPLSDCWRVRPV